MKTTRRRRPSAASRTERSANSTPWSEYLYLNPLGNWTDFVFGILRRTYRDRTNTAREFARAKLHPVDAPPLGAPFRPTAVRWEVLLPPRADDRFLDPARLMEAFDAEALEWRTGLLIYLTLRFNDEDRLHTAYEEAREWARSEFIGGEHRRQLPLLLIQHAPHLVGSENPHHVHALVCPRALTGLGFGAHCEDALTEDAAQKIIYDSWASYRGR